jgi:arylsulfatase I/J
MWDNLLWVSSADNGGPIYASGSAGANNYPMRGGKMSNWQGGVRINGYASGGLLPAAVRGTTTAGLVTGSDWYTTFCGLAGVDHRDQKAEAAGLPPVDGMDMWPLLSGANSTSPRTEVPLGAQQSDMGLPGSPYPAATVVQGIIRADGWKLLIGNVTQNIWTGPTYPNKTTNWTDIPHPCGDPNDKKSKGGCLFNIFTDPTEHEDVAAQNPDIVTALRARIQHYQDGVFSPMRGADDGTACAAALDRWSGFWGPFVP